jgi:hypothetical protein
MEVAILYIFSAVFAVLGALNVDSSVSVALFGIAVALFTAAVYMEHKE